MYHQPVLFTILNSEIFDYIGICLTYREDNCKINQLHVSQDIQI